MAIAKRSSCTPLEQQGIPGPALNPPCYKTETCNTGTGLNLNISNPGKPWVVDYYRQNIGPSDGTDHLDHHQNPVFQQYTQYKDIPIYVDGDISPTAPDENNVSVMTGSAILRHIPTANVGDIVVGELADGDRWMMVVTRATSKSIRPDSDVSISYTVQNQATPGNIQWEDLLNKVDQTYIYYKGEEGTPFITEEEAAHHVKITPYMHAAQEAYKRKFLQGNGSWGLTYGGETILDPFIMGMVSKHESSCGTPLPPVSMMPNKQNVVTLMTERSFSLTSMLCQHWCMRKTRATDMYSYGGNSLLYGYVIEGGPSGTPALPCPPLHGTGTLPPMVINDCMQVDPPCCGCNTDPLNDLNSNYSRARILPDETNELLIKDPFEDIYYVFTEAFYTSDRGNMSLLEKLVTDYLDNKPVTVSDVMPLWLDYQYWCSHSIYYYTPFLLLLSNYAMSVTPRC